MQQITRWQSFDGVEFPTEEACRAHERKYAHRALIGLTTGDVDAMIAGLNPELGEIIELVGRRIARARRIADRTGTITPASAEDENEPSTTWRPK